jgi:hypothetical protein
VTKAEYVACPVLLYIYKYSLWLFLCVIFRAFSFMIVIISPTHAPFTSLLRRSTKGRTQLNMHHTLQGQIW